MVDDDGDTAAVFACTGCGSEWLRSELWTPVDADGHVPPGITAELARGRARGDGRRTPTSGPGAASAGT